MHRISVIAAVVLALATPATLATAAEYNSWSSTPSTWAFASPSGNLSDEPSGLGASRRNPGHIVWENEAPRNGKGMLYAVSSAGLRKAFRFSPAGDGRPTASMLDFEDMAVGPCNGPGSATCWWVGDIGHLSNDFSASSKRTFWLYRIPEPDIATTANNAELTVTGRYPFTVPAAIANEGKLSGSASTFDMETLMVHPKTGEIFVVTKGQNTGGKIRVLKYPGALAAGTSKELQVVKTFQMPRSSTWNPTTLAGEGYHLVTGGDIHPDGRRFALRTYGWIWEFRGSDWASALASTSPVKLPKAGGSLDIQGEAFTYAPDGAKYFTIGEKTKTVTRYVVVYSKTGSSTPSTGTSGGTSTGASSGTTGSGTGGGTTSTATIARDTFGRTLAAGLGSAETGGAWTLSGSSSGYAVDGSRGLLKLTPGTSRQAVLRGLATSTADSTLALNPSAAATGGGLYAAVLGRVAPDGAAYRAKVWISSSGVAQLRLARASSTGAETVLATASSPLTGVTANRTIVVRTRVAGTAPTTLAAKMWFAGAPEPAAWQVQATDSTPGLQRTGGVGVYAYQSSKATTALALRVDDLVVRQ